MEQYKSRWGEIPQTAEEHVNMLIGLWRKDNSVLNYAVPEAKKFISGKRPQWERATVAYYLHCMRKTGRGRDTIRTYVQRSHADRF